MNFEERKWGREECWTSSDVWRLSWSGSPLHPGSSGAALLCFVLLVDLSDHVHHVVNCVRAILNYFI